MRRLAVLPLLAAGVLVAVPADAQDTSLPLSEPLQLNVDRDPELETIRVREVRCYSETEDSAPPCADAVGTVRDIEVDLVNVCDGAEKATRLFVRVENFVTVAESVEIDGDTSAREFIVGGASGASGRNGQILVGAVRDTGDGCPKVRRLLSLGPVKPKTVKPKGSSYFVTGDVTVQNLRKDFRGKELVVRQPWYRSGDGGCCPSFLSTGYYRYKASTDSYVRYKSRTMRIEAER